VKAVVIERPREASYRDVDAPVCGPEDVLVRSELAGVCRTDLDVLLGVLDSRWVRYPCIPGHEWVGTVAEIGERVTDLAPGERVVCEGIVPCRRCRRCLAGDTNLCERYDQLGFTRGGGYGEYVLAPRHVVHPLPEHVSRDTAVLVEPASVVLRGIERGRAAEGETVGVIGVGTLGALAIRLLSLHAPATVIAYGIRAEELDLARSLGADRTVDLTAQEPEDTRLVREGGRVVLLGISGEGTLLELPADRIPLRDLELIGSVGYTSAVWSRVVSIVSDGLVDLGGIVTHRFPAADFEAAFALLDARDGIVGKIVLEHAAGVRV